MNKIKIAAVAAGVLLLAGCGNKAADNQSQSQNQAQVQTQAETKKSGVINSIKDAMGFGKKMKCVYKMKIGEETLETVTYVDGKKYMTETLVAGKKQKMVFTKQIKKVI